MSRVMKRQTGRDSHGVVVAGLRSGEVRQKTTTRRAYLGEMSAGNVPEAVKQFVTCLYGHVRDKNGAFDG